MLSLMEASTIHQIVMECLKTFIFIRSVGLQNHILNYRIPTTFFPQLSDSFIKPDGFIHVIGFAND